MKTKDFILSVFITWRLIMFLPIVAGIYFLSERTGYLFSELSLSLQKTSWLFQLVSPWGNFDGVRYLSIAGRGYTTEAAFFPLFPLTISLFSRILANVQVYSITKLILGVLISNVSFLLSLFIFFKLLKIDYTNKITRESLLFLIAFPTAFFFGGVYSESMFLLLTLLSFYNARKGNWLIAALFLGFASATRVVGILLLPALLIEYFQQKKLKHISIKDVKDISIICLGSFGLFAYSIFNKLKWGNALYFIKAQGELNNGRSINKIIFFPQTVYRYIKILTTLPLHQYEWWISFFELATFCFALTLLFYAFKKKIRLSYLVFTTLAFLVPVSSGTFSGLPRYVLPMFPLFITLALIRNRLFKIFYLVTSVVLQFILLMFFSRGYYVS